MKIINAAKFRNINDWIDDDTLGDIRGFESNEDNNFEVYDAEANEDKLPMYQVDESDDEAMRYLADDYVSLEEPLSVIDDSLQEVDEFRRPQEQDQADIFEEPEIKTKDEAEEEGDFDEVDESVAEETEVDERVPDFATTEDAINAAIKENRVMEIFYVTKGRGSRDEKYYLKRERGLPRGQGGGVNIHRIIEPHYVYEPKNPKNNNKIVVTYDRSVRRIRSFVIDNIYDYNFTKNRKTKEDQYFRPRIKRFPNYGKGIKTMKNINDKLIKIASDLESKGLKNSSSIVRSAEKVLSNFKMAQYVGVQGYWLKNRRCWDNCYRQKRTSQPGTSAQEVWMECWDEYKGSINNPESTWAKYADKSEPIKLGKSEEQSWNKIFADKVDKKVSEGLSRPEAVYSTIEAESQSYTSKMVQASSDLMTLSETLVTSGYKDLGEQMAEMSMEMLKEAQFTGGMGSKFLDFFRSKGGKIAERLQRMIQQINQIMVNIQGGVAASGNNVIKESQVLPSTAPTPAPTVPATTPAAPAPAPAPAKKTTRKAPTPYGEQVLNPSQTALYGKFLSDVRKEMGYLYKMQTKTPELMNITQPAIQAMGTFLTNSDTLFQQTGKKTFHKDKVMVELSNLLNAVTGASSQVAAAESQTPPTENQGAVPPAPASAQEPDAQVQGQTISAFAEWLKGPKAGEAEKQLVQRISTGALKPSDVTYVLKVLGGKGIPLNEVNWNQLIAALSTSSPTVPQQPAQPPVTAP